MLLKVYLAGASRDAVRVRYVASRLALTGKVEFTLPWWDPHPEHGAPEQWTGRDGELADEVQRHVANTNIGGIEDAEVFVGLWPSDGRRSSVECELGFALARAHELDIFVAGAAARCSPFTALADRRFEQDEAMILFVSAMAREVSRCEARL